MKIVWDITLCCWAISGRRFEGRQCIYLQGQAKFLALLNPEDEGFKILRNVCLSKDTA